MPGKYAAGNGCKCCRCKVAQICVTVQGCGSTLSPEPVFGADVTVTQGATTIDSCLTTGRLTGAFVVTGGSGYTNGTYPLTITGGGGSGAAGTVTVSGGAFLGNSVVITNPGSGYTSVPTITVSGAGPGTGATFRARMTTSCCVPLPDVGSYLVTVTKAGFAAQATSVNAGCVQTNLSYTLLPATGWTCCPGACPGQPIPTATMTLTDDNATVVMNRVSSGWSGGYTTTKPNVLFFNDSAAPCCGNVTSTTGSVGVLYGLQCGPANQFTLRMTWYCAQCLPGGPTPGCGEDDNPPCCTEGDIKRGFGDTIASLDHSGFLPCVGGLQPGEWEICHNEPIGVHYGTQLVQRVAVAVPDGYPNGCAPLSLSFSFPDLGGCPHPSTSAIVTSS